MCYGCYELAGDLVQSHLAFEHDMNLERQRRKFDQHSQDARGQGRHDVGDYIDGLKGQFDTDVAAGRPEPMSWYWPRVQEEFDDYRTAAAHAVDPLLDLLEGPTFSRPSPTTLTSPSPQAAEPPVEGVPKGWERYYHHISQQPDTSSNAHVMMPTELVNHYREYQRDPDDPQYQTVKKVVQEHGGIRQPLVLSTNDTHGLLTEGNHRAAIAQELGISKLPVRVYHDDQVQVNEGEPVPHHPAVQQWLDANKHQLPSFWGKRTAAAHPPLPDLWKDYSDWHNEAIGNDDDYRPEHSVQSWGNVEEYLQDRHGLSPYDPEGLDHPVAFGMAKLHSLAQSRPQVDAHDYMLSDDDLTSGAALGLLKIRKNQRTKALEPVDPEEHYGARTGVAPILDSINPTGGLFVDYDPQARTGPHGPGVTTLDKAHGSHPDEPVTIYRGAPRHQRSISPGDFVTTDPALAKMYGENVLQMQVPKSHVATDPDEWEGGEHIYSPH